MPIDALRPALLGLAALSVLRFFGKRNEWVRMLLLLLILVDLVTSGRNLVASRPVSEVMTPPPQLAPLVANPSQGPLYHAAALDRRRGYAVHLAPPPEPAIWKIATTLDPDFDRTQLRWTNHGNEQVRAALKSDPALVAPLLARRGTAAVLAFRGEPGQSNNALRFELLRPIDRRSLVFVAARVESIDQKDQWLEAVRDLGSATATSAVVEKSELTGLPSDYGAGSVESFNAAPDRIQAIVNVSSGPWVLLAFNQSWDRWWYARIDGSERIAVRRIDLSLIGVPLLKGRHNVVIEYDDPWDRCGKILSWTGLFGTLLLLLVGRFLSD
jgi:hypothetical protein